MNSHHEPDSMHLVCRIQPHRLRGWREYSVDSETHVADILRPEAYSSSSPVFRSYVEWATGQGHRIVLWIVTRRRGPTGEPDAFSLAAKMQVRNFHVPGPGRTLPENLQRYDRPWKKGTSHKRHHRIIAEAEPGQSRFYPACDIRECVTGLSYLKLNGNRASGHPQTVMQVDPASVDQLESAATRIASQTVFISYKHDDFKAGAPGPRPPWKPKALARRLIRGGLGIWLDSLCAPQPKPRDGESTEEETLTDEEVRLLLAEGHRQSGVVLGIDTGRYLTRGTGGVKWTLLEYDGSVSRRTCSEPILRFVLHGPRRRELTPPAHCMESWDIDVEANLVPALRSLLARSPHEIA